MLGKLLVRYLRPAWALIIAVVVFQLAQSIASLLLPTLNADIIDNGVVAGDIPYIWQTGGVMLEIVEPAAPIHTPAREVPVTEAGIRHITFRVADVEAEYERLRAAGVEFTVSPRKAVNAELIRKVAFCRDPDGIIVELLERQPSG